VRLLVDANLSPRVALLLAARGHDVEHVHDVGLLHASDVDIAEHAASAGRIVVTSDTDFGTILARTAGTAPSVLLLRHMNLIAPDEQALRIDAALIAARNELSNGCVITISRGRVRVRSLPLG
jgi:predicted nuclease of predicted toxin-antitoxin system